MLEHQVGHTNMRSSAQVSEMKEMPTIMYVDDIHTPDYEPTTTHIEEEQNPTEEVGQPRGG
jgi:hypothetical protein